MVAELRLVYWESGPECLSIASNTHAGLAVQCGMPGNRNCRRLMFELELC